MEQTPPPLGELVNAIEYPLQYRHAPTGSCLRCKNEQALGTLWGAPLGSACISAWYSEKEFGPVAINAALGLSSDPAAWTIAAGEKYADEAKKRTLAWVKAGAP